MKFEKKQQYALNIVINLRKKQLDGLVIYKQSVATSTQASSTSTFKYSALKCKYKYFKFVLEYKYKYKYQVLHLWHPAYSTNDYFPFRNLKSHLCGTWIPDAEPLKITDDAWFDRQDKKLYFQGINSFVAGEYTEK